MPEVDRQPAPVAGGPRPAGRQWEIDALRGLMLVLMTVTHIPTRYSEPLGQPFGFVSAAEGFVTLSAFVAGMVYTKRQLRDGAGAMRSAFLRRAFKIYLCQIGLLAFMLGLIALVGVATGQVAITNLVSFFLAHPFTAAFSGLLLLYNPPLLDILPMYILFMLASPLLLLHGVRRGWGGLLLLSGAIWLAAQFGLSQAGYDEIVRFTGLKVSFRETGSFEMLAWQFLWVIGLWMGASQATGKPVQPAAFPGWAVKAALAIFVLHLIWRHAFGQDPFPGHSTWDMAYDKWKLGPLRLIDFLAMVLLLMHFAPVLSRRLPRLPPLERFGRQSLPVFCAHLVLALSVLATLGDSERRSSWEFDTFLIVACFVVLYAVASISEHIDRRAASLRERLARKPLSDRSPGSASASTAVLRR